jgi:hypothetical protein
VMNIMEHPKWGNPDRRSKPDDFIGDKKRWNEIVRESQKEQPFGPIIVSGHVWMQTINVDLCLIKKPRQAGDDDPRQVCFAALISGNVSHFSSVQHVRPGTAELPRSRCTAAAALGRYR